MVLAGLKIDTLRNIRITISPFKELQTRLLHPLPLLREDDGHEMIPLCGHITEGGEGERQNKGPNPDY